MYISRRNTLLNNEFGIKLKNFRKFKKITQEKLAEMIDIDIRQVARLEAGDSLPSLNTILKLCNIFNITPNDLLLSDENVKTNSIKSDIYDILSLMKPEQLELVKKLILAVL